MNVTEYLQTRGIVDPRVVESARPEIHGGRLWLPWVDAVGREVYRTGRTLNGAEPKYRNVSGERPALYAAPGGSPGAWTESAVVVVEGLLDALAASQGPWPAFATATASIPDPAAEVLRSKGHVIAVPDNDEAGEKWLEDLRVKVAAHTRVQVVRIPSPHKDLADFAASVKGDRDEIAGLLLHAADLPGPEPWHVRAKDVFGGEIPPARDLVARLWADGGVGFIAAEPKSGKGWAMCELALCIPSGEPVFGEFEVPEPGPFLLVAEEDTLEDLQRRMVPMAQGKGIEVPEDLHLAVGRGLLLDDDKWQDDLVAAAISLQLRAVGLDPLVRMHLGDESSARDMSPVLGFLRRLSFESGAAVITAHHTPKPNDTNRSWRPGQRLRGTSDFYAVLDSGLFLTRPKGSRMVGVEVEHRARSIPPPFMFELPGEDQDVIRLTYQPGEVADLKVLEAVEEVVSVLGESLVGMSSREVREAVGGRGQIVDAALARAESLGRVARSEERRPDKRGAMRMQVVWRPA